MYRAAGAGAVTRALVQLAGVWIIAGAVALDPLELAGIRTETIARISGLPVTAFRGLVST